MSTSQPNAAPPMTLAEKVIEQIALSDRAMHKAASELKPHKEKAAEVAALIPGVVDALIANERARPDQREKLAAALTDPAQALQLLQNLAGHRSATELATLGHGVDSNNMSKTAGANPQNSTTNPYVGQRTTRVKQSDVNLFAKLGLGAPQES